jgi:asparagine synthase (glutamine-hydrolysing)
MINYLYNTNIDFSGDGAWQKYSHESGLVYFKGYMNNFNIINIYIDLIKSNKTEIKNRLLLLDGHFSIVIKSKNHIICAVDKVRSCPILWGLNNNNNIIISSVAKPIEDFLSLSVQDIDQEVSKIFALSGYTTGDKTLYSKVKQLNPGTFICINKSEYSIEKYYEWRPWVHKIDKKKDISDLNNTNENIIKKLIKSVNGRQIVIPLSAGMDSRFIVSGLKHFKYQNVICVSYGIKNNKDAYIAKKIANHLEYDWIFIEYSSKLFSKAFKSDDYKNYLKFCDSLTSIHFAGEYLMLSKLKEENKIDSNAIFINGQSGDFISGNHIPSELISLNEITKSNDDLFYKVFLDKHYKHWKNIDTENYNKIIIGFLEKELLYLKKDKKNFSYVSAYEYIEFKDRQSKYVINGQRTYEYFGYDWRLPLWDCDYLDFWKDVEIEKKIKQNLYVRTLKSYNWCGTWDKIDINPYSISPAWIKPIRFILKLFFIFLGKKRWHKFERKYLDYFMTTTCCYGPWSYFQIVFDKRGHDSPIGWIIEHYLNLKNINWKGELIDR